MSDDNVTFECKIRELYKTKDALFKVVECSKFFRTLQDYLGTKEQILVKKPAPVVYWKGSGNGVHLRKFELKFGELYIEIDVDYWEYEYSDPPYGNRYTEDSIDSDTVTYRFWVPMELIDGCTKEEFDKWTRKGHLDD